MNARLQPLRIPTGWRVEYNNGLWEIDPSDASMLADDRRSMFKEDMLQLTHARFRRLLDVGWYPEADIVQGTYRLVAHEDDFRGRLLHEFETRDRLALVAEIERLLASVNSGDL